MSPAPVTAETPTDRRFLATDVPPFNWDPRSGYSSDGESVLLAIVWVQINVTGLPLEIQWIRSLTSGTCPQLKMKDPQNSTKQFACLVGDLLDFSPSPTSLPPLCCIQPLPCLVPVELLHGQAHGLGKRCHVRGPQHSALFLLNLRKLEDVSIGRRFFGGSTSSITIDSLSSLNINWLVKWWFPQPATTWLILSVWFWTSQDRKSVV